VSPLPVEAWTARVVEERREREERLRNALRQCDGNISMAARRMGLSLRYVSKMMTDFGLRDFAAGLRSGR